MKVFSTFSIFSLALASPKKYSQSDIDEFKEWMVTYEKSYESEDHFMMRLGHYMNNLETIAQINSENRGWTAGPNKFTDLEWDEFKYFYLMKAGNFLITVFVKCSKNTAKTLITLEILLN